MRGFGGKQFGIPRQNGCRHAKAQLVVDVGKGLQEPHTKKTRSASDKKRSVFRFVPKLPRVREDMVKIFDGQRAHEFYEMEFTIHALELDLTRPCSLVYCALFLGRRASTPSIEVRSTSQCCSKRLTRSLSGK